MRTLIPVMAAALLLVASPNADAKKTNQNRMVGTVVNVVANNTGAALTVNMAAAGQITAGNAGQMRTFVLTNRTTLHKSMGPGKGNRTVVPAQLTDLRVGLPVRITARGNQVQSVHIMSAGVNR
jgi:hypothetical protein